MNPKGEAVSRRRVAAVRLFLAFALAAVPTAGRGQPAADGTPGPALRGWVLHSRGVVDVGRLLPPSPEELRPRTIPFRAPDPTLPALTAPREPGEPAPLDASPQLAPSLGPALTASFIGLRLSDTVAVIPPDTQVAAGPNHLFEMVNVTGRILTRGGVALSTFGLNSFFGLSPGAETFDPKIRFDVLSNRWFVVVAEDLKTGGAWHLAVSQSSDPTGTFFLYTLQTPGSLPDFPALGLNDDKAVLTANAFRCTTVCAGSFLGAEFLVVKKADLLAGAVAPAFQFVAPDPSFPTIQPAHSLSSTSTLFMVAGDDADPTTTIKIWSLTGIPPAVGVTTTTRTISALGIPDDAVQPGGGITISTNDNRFLDVVFRNGVLWASANAACNPAALPGGRGACMRFTQILTASLTVNQDFTFGTLGVSYYYPAVQLDNKGNLVTVFSRSSGVELPSVYVSGRLTTDPPSTLQTPVRVKAGENVYDPKSVGFPETRWGDYSGAAIDPSDQSAVWVAGEYARAEGGAEWGTWIAQVTIASLFADVPADYWARAWIEALFKAGVTGGCATAPLRYCPTAAVTREQMAVFLLKAHDGPGVVPPPCTAPGPFADVPCSSIFAPWIGELVTRGITAGCGGGNYCPANPVTRQEMAVFLLRTLGVTPGGCATAPFADVPCSSPFAPWIQELVTRGITAGCSATSYCPTSPVTRDQMAVFLVKAFSLPFP